LKGPLDKASSNTQIKKKNHKVAHQREQELWKCNSCSSDCFLLNQLGSSHFTRYLSLE
jgi:hypothetical protein